MPGAFSSIQPIISSLPPPQHPVTALTWGHNDRRIFVATGPEVHIAWVSTRISSLQLICSLQIYKEIAQGSKQTVYQLPLPNRIRQIISKLFMHTIRVSKL
jgi:hypothetical protein